MAGVPGEGSGPARDIHIVEDRIVRRSTEVPWIVPGTVAFQVHIPVGVDARVAGGRPATRWWSCQRRRRWWTGRLSGCRSSWWLCQRLCSYLPTSPPTMIATGHRPRCIAGGDGPRPSERMKPTPGTVAPQDAFAPTSPPTLETLDLLDTAPVA